MRIEFAPSPTSLDVLPLVGPEAEHLLRVRHIDGFGNPRARAITTGGPGLALANVREVLPELPVEMTLAGLFVADDLDAVVRRYSALLDFMAGHQPGSSAYTSAVLRLQDSVGILQRRVLVKDVHLPRDASLGTRTREFEVVFESWEPSWVNPSRRTPSLGTTAGTKTVTNAGRWPVYPLFTFTAGGSGLTNLTLASTTDAGRQVSFTTTYAAGTVLTVDMDPRNELAVVGSASQQAVMAFGDRRFQLWPGDNTLSLSFAGTLAAATCAFFELWPGV